ncbi:uncharacterized protein PG998_009182 [Apiospora kogelbergensis]|uniref:uncharacterized protein n=1 Tax=Apiospora kogelbergensis TaxID=1337665 RepID=UPI00312DEBD3
MEPYGPSKPRRNSLVLHQCAPKVRPYALIGPVPGSLQYKENMMMGLYNGCLDWAPRPASAVEIRQLQEIKDFEEELSRGKVPRLSAEDIGSFVVERYDTQYFDEGKLMFSVATDSIRHVCGKCGK